MIEYERLTTEEGLRTVFKDRPETIGTLLKAEDGTTLTYTLSLKFEVPTTYAKAILYDYLREKLEQK